MVAGTKRLLAIATTVSASVIDLPVAIKNTYVSVEFDVGTPPKPHNLMFDTGSASAWMVNTDCTENSCLDGSGTWYTRQYYNASASSSASDRGAFSAIPYEGGRIAGHAMQDVFSLPDGTIEWNQTFLSANESSWRFITADGFLGLGFSTIAEPDTSTLVETLLWKGELDEPRFGLFYGTNLKDEGAQDGVLSLGGSHEEKYVEGEMVYTPLMKENQYELWRAPLRSINVLVARNPSEPNSTVEIHNGRLPTTNVPEGAYPKTNTTWPFYGSGSAVFDTGAGTLGVPENIIGALYFNLGWNYTKLISGEERMDCQHMNASWAVTLTLGEADAADDVSFSVRGDELIRPGAQCMPPIDSSGYNSFALIGASFLRRHYSVFDFGADKVAEYKPRIGFGRLKKEYDYQYQ